MSFVIAAYTLILGTLAVYAWRLRGQRRLLERLARQTPERGAADIIDAGSAEKP
jgi:hypothetical protein